MNEKKPPFGCCGGEEIHLPGCQTSPPMFTNLDPKLFNPDGLQVIGHQLTIDSPGTVIVEGTATQFDRCIPVSMGCKVPAPEPCSLPYCNTLREPLARFAALMERKLLKHDAKWNGNSWPGTSNEDLLKGLREHLEKLERHLKFPLPEQNEESINKQLAVDAADVANYCMMLADNATRK